MSLIEPRGLSLISDIDDTIKRSNIPLGAREIFRNTFIRDLGDLCIDGVREWFGSLHHMGVQFHYCSNSPWQLYPVLATYFIIAGLPRGSLHLKQYSGMLQGIFEPVAERKKSTLDRILRDFPDRRFLLVGDSGEADLEVYTDLALANPGRILAIFIRDVTTPQPTGFFDSAYPQDGKSLGPIHRAWVQGESNRSTPPALPPRRPSGVPAMGDLIDLSEELQDLRRMKSAESLHRTKSQEAEDIGGRSMEQNGKGSAPPPTRPAKPLALRSAPSELSTRKSLALLGTAGGGPAAPHPLKQMQNSSDQLLEPKQTPGRQPLQPNALVPPQDASISKAIVPPPPPAPRRRGTPSAHRPSPRLLSQEPQRQPSPSERQDSPSDCNSDVVPLEEALPASAYPSYQADGSNSLSSVSPPVPSHSKPPGQQLQGSKRDTLPPTSNFSSAPSTSASGMTTPGAGMGGGTCSPVLNKKVELWMRRVARAHEVLDQQGVALYTWRRGEDVVAEAEGIVRGAMKQETGARGTEESRVRASDKDGPSSQK